MESGTNAMIPVLVEYPFPKDQILIHLIHICYSILKSNEII